MAISVLIISTGRSTSSSSENRSRVGITVTVESDNPELLLSTLFTTAL